MSDTTPDPASVDTATTESASSPDVTAVGDGPSLVVPLAAAESPSDAETAAADVAAAPGAVPAELATPEQAAARVPTGAQGKTRSPFGGWLLVILTLGIYYLFWYHNINRELRDYDPRIKVSPGWAVVCLFIPIVGLISIFNTGSRIRSAQATAGVSPEASGLIGLIASLFLVLDIPYYSSQLNKVWSVTE